MSISQKALFKIALNLEDPWYIKTIDFSAEGKQLDINVDFDPGSKFPCAKCGNPGCGVHDTIERTWLHLNFFFSLKPISIVVFLALSVKTAE